MRTFKRLSAILLLPGLTSVMLLGGGTGAALRTQAAAAARTSVGTDATGDGDMYHVMRPAQGDALSGDLLGKLVCQPWQNGFTREEVKRHDGTTGTVYRVDNEDKEQEAGLSFPLTAAEMTPGTYTMSAFAKAQNVVEHETPAGIYFSFSLAVMLTYKDGRSFNYDAEFSFGTHDWEQREVSFTVDRELKDVQIYAFLRKPCTGTVWFDEVTLVRSQASVFHNTPVEVLRTAPERDTKAVLKTKDGLSLGLGAHTVTSLKVDGRELANDAYSGFLVRDIARKDGVFAFAPRSGSRPAAFRGRQDTLGLDIDANYEAKDDCIAVTGTIRETAASADGRAVALSYALPVTASGWRWGDDILTSRSIATGGTKDVYKKLGEFGLEAAADWDGAAHSLYPTSTIYNDDLGIAIAVSMAFPSYWELEYNGCTQQYVLTYQFGIVKEAPDAAKFSFVIYKLDEPKWGFRAAMEKYTRLFPEQYVVRQKEQGLWLGPQDVQYESIPNIEDFNIRFNEESRDRNEDYLRAQGSQEIDRGILGLQYIEPSGFWIPGSAADLSEPTTERVMQVLRELAQSSDPSLKFLSAMSKATLAGGGILDRSGKLQWMPTNAAWSKNGVRINVNFSPFLPEPNFWSLYLSDKQWATLFDASAAVGFPFDGIYLDELSGWPTGNANYNKAHYAYTTVPLTYSPHTKTPFLHRASSNWEWVKKLSDKLHAEGKILFANKAAERTAFNSVLVDVLGTEWWGYSNGAYYQCSLEQMSQYRTLAYQKPFCLLLSSDFRDGRFDTDELERYIQYCLLFGIFPSPWDNTGSEDERYWDNPALYERDRAVWKKYSPVLKTVAEAGWEPVTYATASDKNVLVERYGSSAKDGVYFAVHNTGAAERRVTVDIPADRFSAGSKTVYRELVSGKPYTLSGGRCTVTLAPYQTVVLAMEEPKAADPGKTETGSATKTTAAGREPTAGSRPSPTAPDATEPDATEQPQESGIIFSGQLFDGGDNTIVGAMIELQPIGKQTVTDDEGRFTFKGIAWGEYTLRVLDAAGTVQGERRVILSYGEKTGIDGDTLLIAGKGIGIKLYLAQDGTLAFGRTAVPIDRDPDAPAATGVSVRTVLLIAIPAAVLAIAGGLAAGLLLGRRRKRRQTATA